VPTVTDTAAKAAATRAPRVSRAVLAKLDAAAALLSDVVLNYATKDTS
jgi:hypothetical protein